MEDSSSNLQIMKAVLAFDDAPTLMELHGQVSNTLATEFGAEIVSQPAATLSGVCLTKQEFSDNSVQLSADFSQPHPSNDYRHMNRRFGAEMMGEIIARFRTAPLSPSQ